jgi:hypothetical protein
VYKNNHCCSGLLLPSEDRMEEAKRRAQKIIVYGHISTKGPASGASEHLLLAEYN